MHDETFRYRRFLKIFAAGAIPIIVLVNIHVLFLWNAGETRPYTEVVSRQLASNGLYLTSFATSYYSYKLALAQAVKPDILVIGSSRTMQFRGDHFTVPLTNAAGSAQNWTVAQSFLDELVATHSPKILLLGLEYNWFREELYPHDVEKDEPTRLTQFKLREPFRWIVDGKLSVPQYLAIAAGLVTKTPSGHTGMGIQALVRDKGFFSDGRMHYAPDDFPATDPRTDSHFHDTLPYVEKGEKTFFFGRHVGQPNWERFEKFARTCQEHGIELVTYFPPLARPLYDLLNKIEDRRVYVEELRAKLERFQGIEFYDLSNGTALGSTDCEYYNGTHAGDVAYSRILLDISKKNPSSALAPFLNTDYLKRTIELYSGRAVAESGFAETDFLELGCNKRPIYTTANP